MCTLSAYNIIHRMKYNKVDFILKRSGYDSNARVLFDGKDF